jgi:hypothetical protein
MSELLVCAILLYATILQEQLKNFSLKEKKKGKWVKDMISGRETFDLSVAFLKDLANDITL